MTRYSNFYLDRFEGDFAVLLAEGVQIDFPRGLLPPEAVDGDTLTFSVNVDKEQGIKTAAEITRLRQRLAGEQESEEK